MLAESKMNCAPENSTIDKLSIPQLSKCGALQPRARRNGVPFITTVLCNPAQESRIIPKLLYLWSEFVTRLLIDLSISVTDGQLLNAQSSK